MFKPQGFQSVEYGHVVESLYRKVICKELSAHDENISLSDSLLASIKLQLLALELTPLIQLPDILTRMKDLEEKFITLRKTSFDPSRKLNVLKKDMAQLEWYKKKTKNEGVGYYDSFRNMYSQWDHDIIGFHKNLTRCWEKMVEEADMEPQKEGAQFRSRWLYAGTNYRRMVEPLIISQYYRDKGQDYVNKKRYKALKNYEVSPEIFLPKSSYMSWWKEYKAIKGSSYDSTLASFMGNTRNYKQYALGTFDFLSMYNDCPIKCVIQHL
ncbi:hypothetical protein TanjilG_13160 [Lupinus angustifolius]|nr:hypothetical protein TanjilG_13160 [Lupinus angustifolius]